MSSALELLNSLVGGGTVPGLGFSDEFVKLYAYDGRNRMTASTVSGVKTAYAYRPDGLRQSKTTAGVTTSHLWDGANIAADLENGAVKDVYVRALGLLYARGSGSALTYGWYLYNGHGDVTGLADASGNLSRSYEYDAFGNPLPVSGTPVSEGNPFRYCGEYLDAETRFVYLRARYYDPASGRFTGEDPAMQGTNWYSYCGGNPILFLDPTGLSGIKVDGSYYITHSLDEQLLKLKQEYEGATQSRREQIAIEAQNIRNGGIEGVDWSVRADRSLNYYMIDTDVTDKLNDLMKTAGDANFWKRFLDLTPITAIALYADFAWMVRPGGEYDLKSKSEWQGKEHFIYNNEVIWYDDPGNMLYGYLGKAMGFEDYILYVAAGAVQIATGSSSWSYVSSFFDDPRDQISIKMGIQRYKDTNSWIWW